MSCRRRRRRFEEEVESVRDIRREKVESETESFCNSDRFLIIWRDSEGRRRCKCCRRGCRE